MARRRSSQAQSFGVFSQGNFAGTDQGVDFSGAGPIPALGDGIVTDVGSTTGDRQGLRDYYVIYKLTSGPYQGHYIYAAENLQPRVRIGQKVKQGESIGQAPGNYPYIEVGFNKSARNWAPVAPLGPPGNDSTPQGEEMWKFIQGVIGTGPKVTGPDLTGIPGGSPGPAEKGTRGKQESTIPSVLDQDQEQPFSPQESGMDSIEGASGYTQGFTQSPTGGLNDLTGLPLNRAASMWQELAQQQTASPETRQFAANAGQLTSGMPDFLLS